MKNNIMEAFVYLWQDARQKPYRYYLGYHKGHPDDGYTHSSTVFESFNKDNIPNGVRRRILATGTSEEMMELENKLLNNRKESKWDIYYNLTTSFPPYMWDDPDYREKMNKQWKDPDFCAMQSDRLKKLWKDPEFRAMHSDRSKKLWEDPTFREMRSESTKKQWEDPDFRAMQSKKSKKLWKDPEFRKMQSESTKKQWEDPEFRKMMSELSKKKFSCNVCGFVSTIGNIARWHNDNCKHR